MMGGRSVKPGRRRWIVGPRMPRAGVVGHVVDQHFHAELVRIGDQRLIFLHRSHALVERVEVDAMVAVIIGVGIFPDGREPESIDAEIVQIIEVLPNSAQIAPMIGMGIAAIVNASRAGRTVVCRIAVGEAVGHDEIDDVVTREVLETAGGVDAVLKGYLNCGLSAGRSDAQLHFSSTHQGVQLYMYKNVMSVSGCFRAQH